MKRLLPFLCLLLLLSGCSHRNYPTEAGDTGKWYFPLPGGVDLKTKNKDKIFAAFDGEVVFSGTFSGYGNLVRIKHANGLETYYAHNSKNLVKQGAKVRAGQVIALTGQTGRASTPHLHFETRVGGKPRDPTVYFDLVKGSLRQNAFRRTKKGFVAK